MDLIQIGQPPTDAEKTPGDLPIDPVCGMAVVPPGEGSFAYRGQAYFFCCRGCLEKFKGDPLRYLDAKRRPQLAVVPGATYTCPMHPEIIRSEPGTCPKCGMALEPRTVTVEEKNPELVDMSRRFSVSLALSIPVMLLAMGKHLPGNPIGRLLSLSSLNWVELILATSVVLWAGWPF